MSSGIVDQAADYLFALILLPFPGALIFLITTWIYKWTYAAPDSEKAPWLQRKQRTTRASSEHTNLEQKMLWSGLILTTLAFAAFWAAVFALRHDPVEHYIRVSEQIVAGGAAVMAFLGRGPGRTVVLLIALALLASSVLLLLFEGCQSTSF